MAALARSLLAFGVATAIAAPARRAFAEHQHGGHAEAQAEPGGAFRAGVSVVAAQFDQTSYGGDYQGVTPSLRWSDRRLGATAGVTLYRLQENGRELFGPGDAFVHGQVTLFHRARSAAGVALMVTAPTGDHLTGLGMGHVMVMPGLWAQHALGRIELGASAGYGRAIGGGGHVHGAWPLVDPMNLEELTWSATGDVAIARSLRAGARIGGATPVGDGVMRMVAGVHAAWGKGRVETGLGLDAGLAGDPFTVRGVAETTLRF